MIRIFCPMAGEGKQFLDRGYIFPKPLIEIAGKPLIEVVLEKIIIDEPHQFIFICREEHLQKFALKEVLELLVPGSIIIEARTTTAGSLCSLLLAIEYLDTDDELLIMNGDQYIDASIMDFIQSARSGNWDGYIMTFPSRHPKWSYVQVEGEEIVAVAEKRPISNKATVGLYYFRQGCDFLLAAERMLYKNATVKGEFYVCPVYNELIMMGKRISYFPIECQQMYSLGTPDDVQRFLNTKAQEMNW